MRAQVWRILHLDGFCAYHHGNNLNPFYWRITPAVYNFVIGCKHMCKFCLIFCSSLVFGVLLVILYKLYKEFLFFGVAILLSTLQQWFSAKNVVWNAGKLIT